MVYLGIFDCFDGFRYNVLVWLWKSFSPENIKADNFSIFCEKDTDYFR